MLMTVSAVAGGEATAVPAALCPLASSSGVCIHSVCKHPIDQGRQPFLEIGIPEVIRGGSRSIECRPASMFHRRQRPIKTAMPRTRPSQGAWNTGSFASGV